MWNCEPAQPTADPERVVITEFFSYQRPRCYSFHPALDAWIEALPEDMLVEKIAVSIGRPTRVPIARAFYALQAMDEIDRFDALIFEAIHVARRESRALARAAKHFLSRTRVCGALMRTRLQRKASIQAANLNNG